MIAGHLVPVARSQVQWAQTDGDYVRLHIPGQSYLVRAPLRCLAKRWAEHGFMRIHRFYLVFFPLVTDVWRGPSGYNVRLGSGPDAVNLPVSRQHEQELKNGGYTTTITETEPPTRPDAQPFHYHFSPDHGSVGLHTNTQT